MSSQKETIVIDSRGTVIYTAADKRQIKIFQHAKYKDAIHIEFFRPLEKGESKKIPSSKTIIKGRTRITGISFKEDLMPQFIKAYNVYRENKLQKASYIMYTWVTPNAVTKTKSKKKK